MQTIEPNDIELTSMGKLFEYEKQSRLIDSLDIDELKKISKLYLKMYLKQQEVLQDINNI